MAQVSAYDAAQVNHLVEVLHAQVKKANAEVVRLKEALRVAEDADGIRRDLKLAKDHLVRTSERVCKAKEEIVSIAKECDELSKEREDIKGEVNTLCSLVSELSSEVKVPKMAQKISEDVFAVGQARFEKLARYIGEDGAAHKARMLHYQALAWGKAYEFLLSEGVLIP